MELQLSDEGRMVPDRPQRFLDDRILGAERSHDAEAPEIPTGEDRPTLKALRREARELGPWSLYLPDPDRGSETGPLDYALLCEATGTSAIAPRVFDCDAPDPGNADILLRHGSEAQKRPWLRPLLDGEIRSCFSTTEPDSSGSDPAGLRTRAVRDGSDRVIDGHEWFTTGAIGARFAIVMTVTDARAPPHRRASMFIVPVDTPGVHLVCDIPAMGHLGGGSHCEIADRDGRGPAEALLGPENEGFAVAQSRLGPGRIHQCMRAIGMAERAFGILCRHANLRETRGTLLAATQFIQHWVARSRIEITQARLLTHHAALKLEQEGSRAARHELAMTKAVVPGMLMAVLDRTMQALGALGMSDDTPVAAMWRTGRTLRIADGPDEVHEIAIARRELARIDESGGAARTGSMRDRPTRGLDATAGAGMRSVSPRTGTAVTAARFGSTTPGQPATDGGHVRLTLHTDYSIRVLLYLAAQGEEESIATIGGIADTHGISQNHLTKVIRTLVRGGHVRTLRGRSGGLRLARPPAEIRLGQLVRETEPDFSLVECMGRNGNCVLEPACRVRSVLIEARDAFLAVLDRYSLADMLEDPAGMRRVLRIVEPPAKAS